MKKSMFPRPFVEWLVNNCWHNKINDSYGLIEEDVPNKTLDELYLYWLNEVNK